MKTKKKWLRKTTAICTAALLGAAAIPSTAFAADSYTSIEKDAWAKKAAEMASAYATSIEEGQSLMSGMKSDMSLKFEDTGRSLLGIFAPFDVSWLDDITLSNDISFTDGKEGLLMKVLLNGSEICTLEYYLDSDTQDIYMRVPEISDKYIKTNLKEAAEQQASNIESDIEELTPDSTDTDIPTDNFASAYSDSLGLSVSMMSDLAASVPEASVVETLLDKYGSMLFDNVTEGESTQETLTTGGVSQDCTVYEGQVSTEEIIKTMTAILEELKSDSDIEDIFNTWTDKLSADEDLYENFTKTVEDGLDSLKNTEIDESDDSHFSTRIWVDETGRIAGREIEINDGDTIIPVLTWQMTKNGSDFGYLLSTEADGTNTYSLSGSGQIESDKLNGTYELSQNDKVAAVIEVKDYDTASAKEGYLNGNYTLTFPADTSEDEETSSLAALQDIAFVLDLNSAKDSGSGSLSVVTSGSTIGTFSVTSGAGDGVEIPDLTTLGDAYNVTNDDDMSAYSETIDTATIMDNLSKAGVPEEVITDILNSIAGTGDDSTEDSTEGSINDTSDDNTETSDSSSDAAA